MKTLTALQNMLNNNLNLLGVAADQVEVWMENGDMVPGSFKETDDGLHYLDFEYRAALAIERMPAEMGGLLALLVYQFATQLGERNELPWPSIALTMLDGGRFVDVECTLEIREPVFVVPVQNSPIVIQGQPMGFAMGGLDIATEGSIDGHITEN